MDNDNVIERNFNAFLDKLREASPGIIGEGSESIKILNGCGTAVIPFLKQQKMDDFTDELEEKLSVNILYALRNVNKKEFCVIMYSLPYDSRMYVIMLQSCMYGIVGKMTVSFYASLDVMFRHINDRYQNIDDTKWQILEKEKPEVLFSKFIT